MVSGNNLLLLSAPAALLYGLVGGHFRVSSGLFSGNKRVKFGLSRAFGSPGQLIS